MQGGTLKIEERAKFYFERLLRGLCFNVLQVLITRII
jgi:hypothetical protein